MRILRSVGSSDTITARAGLNELNDILESPEKQAALRDYEEIYIENVCLQLKVRGDFKFFVDEFFFFELKIIVLFRTESVTDSSIRCVGYLSTIVIKHLFLLHITNIGQKCWHRTTQKIHGFNHRFNGGTEASEQRRKRVYESG